LNAALAGIAPNQKVLERDRRQPEFTMTWAQYRSRIVTDKRIEDGRQAVGQNRSLLLRVSDRWRVAPGIIAGIWGLESSYGTITGDYHVVEALATLAWDGRRASFFRGELMAALKIIDQGNIVPARMTGSYAGAMGQPQFMPTSYLAYAADLDGDGRRDIWTNRGDVFASVANYLARAGNWRGGESWGQQVILPPGFDPNSAGRDRKRPLGEWARQGVRPLEGVWNGSSDTPSAVVIPDGVGGEAFVVYHNFNAIRRYNPSDFYALAVGLLGDRLGVG
ncbi:MAG: lytic transglycosylase domain-containing protein, partial [Acetobacteraceae bacterium]